MMDRDQVDVKTLKDEIVEKLDELSLEQLKTLLSLTRQFAVPERPRGESLSSLREIVGLFPKEDIEQIQQAIEEDCEKIDWDDYTNRKLVKTR